MNVSYKKMATDCSANKLPRSQGAIASAKNGQSRSKLQGPLMGYAARLTIHRAKLGGLLDPTTAPQRNGQSKSKLQVPAATGKWSLKTGPVNLRIKCSPIYSNGSWPHRCLSLFVRLHPQIALSNLTSHSYFYDE